MATDLQQCSSSTTTTSACIARDDPGSSFEDEAQLTRPQQIAASLSKLEGLSSIIGDTSAGGSMGAAVDIESADSGMPATFPAGDAVSDVTMMLQPPRPSGLPISEFRRNSAATLDSLLTSGETVYEDANEKLGEVDLQEVGLPILSLSELAQSPIFFHPTTRSPTDLAAAAKAGGRGSPSDRLGSPPRSASGEQATLLQRRMSLQAQAEAARWALMRHSVSACSSADDAHASLASLRRQSALSASAQVPIATRRLSSTASATASSTRPHGHLKPLVLTPSRTVQAPLTSLGPASPTGRRASAFAERGDGAFMRRGSIKSDNGVPPSAEGFFPTHRAQRRSIGYVDSGGDGAYKVSPHHDATTSRSSVEGRRSRTVSQDTAASRSTDESGLSRSSSSPPPDSPDTSVDGSNDEKAPSARTQPVGPRGSPLLSDGEWEREYERHAGWNRSRPLERVEEGNRVEQEIPVPDLHVLAPALSFTAATPSTIHAPASPSTLHAPESTSITSSPRLARQKAKYDEHWIGSTVSDSAAEDSDAAPTSPGSTDSPASVQRSSSPTPRKGKPIVIKSVTARSSAVNARRSQRLSQIEPPVDEASHRASRAMRRLSSAQYAATNRPSQPYRGANQVDGPSSPSRAGPEEALQRRKSSLAGAHKAADATLSGLAIWPPPAGTKRLSLAQPLEYASDSESAAGFSGLESEAEDAAPANRRSSDPSTRRHLRRPAFQPRNPRAAPEEDDFDAETLLEVLLTEEPPARPLRSRSIGDIEQYNRTRRTEPSSISRRKASAPTLGAVQPHDSIDPAYRASGLTKKLFGALRVKTPEPFRKPISIAPHTDASCSTAKPRPAVSRPLELQAASTAMAQQRSVGSADSSVKSYDFGRSTMRSNSAVSGRLAGRPMVHYPSVAAASTYRIRGEEADESREELASLHFDSSTDDLRSSLDAVMRHLPDVPPALPAKHLPLPTGRYGRRSSGVSVDSLSSTSTGSLSSSSRHIRSRMGSLSLTRGSLAFPSPSHAVKMERQMSTDPVRAPWRLQALEV